MSLTVAMTNKAGPKIRLLPWRGRDRESKRDREREKESITRIKCKHSIREL